MRKEIAVFVASFALAAVVATPLRSQAQLAQMSVDYAGQIAQLQQEIVALRQQDAAAAQAEDNTRLDHRIRLTSLEQQDKTLGLKSAVEGVTAGVATEANALAVLTQRFNGHRHSYMLENFIGQNVDVGDQTYCVANLTPPQSSKSTTDPEGK